METSTSLDPRTLAKLRGLSLRARHIVEGYVAGLHKSPYHGFSIEFAEHREYAPGDDLRYVDWKVFGRTDKIYLKQYEDETNLLCYLVLDVSESMRYQSREAALSKIEYAQCLAAALGWLVLQQQDAVGLATFDSQLRSLIRPSGSPSHLEQLINVMESAPAGKKTAAGPIFHELAERLTKRGVVIVLSDFFDDVNSLVAGLKHFRHRRHDVVLWHVLDPAEIDFNFAGPTQFKGLENYPEIQADPQVIRRAYLREFAAFQRALQQACRTQQIDYVLMRTDQPIDVALTSFLAGRRRRAG
ncbi:MAG: DUF58 domain-containing protein [Pirellulaceae bacterium]|nr:DUF58 domain-containing protein [Pirellulaceae bacterium]